MAIPNKDKAHSGQEQTANAVNTSCASQSLLFGAEAHSWPANPLWLVPAHRGSAQPRAAAAGEARAGTGDTGCTTDKTVAAGVGNAVNFPIH